MPILIELVRPRSVVDVGCGTGGWLAAFQAHGVPEIVGLDGPDVPLHRLQFPKERFIRCDLQRPLPLRGTFDLVVCLEVAEHLPPRSGTTLVQSLTQLGPVVLFSAAIPYQRGDGHVNERWQDEWVRDFARYGFQVADLVRPRIWGMADVEPWYRQNTLVFVSARNPRALAEHRASEEIVRLVHPDLWLHLNARTPTIREWVGQAPRVLRQSAGYRLGRVRDRLRSIGRRSSTSRSP